MSKTQEKTQYKEEKVAWINERKYNFTEPTTILLAANDLGIKIPTLCYYKDITPTGACRVCVVEVEGIDKPVPSCSTSLKDGMKVHTNTARIREIRRTLLELIVANHPNDCLYCVRNGNCELQELCKIYGIREHKYLGEKRSNPLNLTSDAIVRDPNKCILCERCVKVCDEVQSVSAIDLTERGFKTIISTAFNRPIDSSSCVLCGQCIRVCPTGALKERSANVAVQDAINDKKITTVVQVAPSISVTIGEEFGFPPGKDVTPQLVSALRHLGFDAVFDTVFGADLTIMEEANELVKRLTSKDSTMPMISTCCPAWIKFMETEYPELIPNMSTCKSPMSMQGAIIKNFWANKVGINPSSVYQVAIMPCVAKKFEKQRAELVNDGYPNTDAVLTTRELVRRLRSSGIDLSKMPEEEYDDPMGESTGAGKIFGTTGGVMEAAIRTAYWLVNKRNLEDVDVQSIRGFDGIKKATIEITPEIKVNCVAAHGLANARKICEELLKGNPNNYHFIEIMACPGGCINGGGQPRGIENDTLERRAKCLYDLDKDDYQVRLSHENNSVQRLYSTYLKGLGSKEAHHILHTKYYPRKEENY